MRTTFDPVALRDAPGVNEFLGRIGLGELADPDVASLIGRNDNWAGVTSRGVAVFVKRVLGGAGTAKRQIRRSLAFEATVGRVGREELLTPTVLGHGEAAPLIVTELLTDAVNGTELAERGTFEEDLSHRAGRAVGLLHGAPTEGAAPALDTSAPALPNVAWCDALPLPLFLNLSFAEVSLWNIVHADRELCAALARLRRWESAAERRPVHCDLRLDQFLLAGGLLHLIDGEEFRLADPARDVGSFAGEWLHRALGGLAGGRTEHGRIDRGPSHEELVATGTRELARLQPRIAEFWTGYRSARAAVDSGLAVRATAFAGWHLIDRALGAAEQSSRLSAATRAAMGVGRTALVHPEKFVRTLGLGDGP
ncbi:class V lanthionine synthetase subunit LxmK [Streptomyces sp. Edi2]|uniref:class V lanthionine synthetase subunit LxmK n=1 Tax=Streptomyces sp. Edi2 TaxID=3162528 RepID=UPI003305FB4C